MTKFEIALDQVDRGDVVPAEEAFANMDAIIEAAPGNAATALKRSPQTTQTPQTILSAKRVKNV